MQGNIFATKKPLPKKGDTLLFLFFENDTVSDLFTHIFPKEICQKIDKKIKLFHFSGKKGEYVAFEADPFYSNILLIGGGKKKNVTVLALKNQVAEALRKVRAFKPATVHMWLPSGLAIDMKELGKSISIAYFVSEYVYHLHKKEETRKKHHHIPSFILYTDSQKINDIKEGMDHGKHIAGAIEYARHLINEPASHVYPSILAKKATEIATKSPHISVSILGQKECEEIGMGAFTAVAKGSEHEAKFIVLKYDPHVFMKGKGENAKTICLIGKSITFDSGGLSLKPASAMEDMKIDMSGGATVLGIFDYLSKTSLQIPYITYGILPACENMPSGKSMRPGDIVKTIDGTSVEVLNTDAEGRMTLSDAIAYAELKLHPDVIIDIATLTGACMVALGPELTGLFGNDPLLNKLFIDVANYEGDAVWEMPLYERYLERMKSRVADLKNIGGAPHYGGAITAALFIREFVKKAKWIHLDIAGPAYNNGKPVGIIDTGGTGWGIQTIIHLLNSSQLI